MTYTKEECEYLRGLFEPHSKKPTSISVALTQKECGALASALRIASRASWHRIDDPVNPAPKDGTRFLYCAPPNPRGQKYRTIAVIRWPEYEECFSEGFWRPLPPPPDEGG